MNQRSEASWRWLSSRESMLEQYVWTVRRREARWYVPHTSQISSILNIRSACWHLNRATATWKVSSACTDSGAPPHQNKSHYFFRIMFFFFISDLRTPQSILHEWICKYARVCMLHRREARNKRLRVLVSGRSQSSRRTTCDQQEFLFLSHVLFYIISCVTSCVLFFVTKHGLETVSWVFFGPKVL